MSRLVLRRLESGDQGTVGVLPLPSGIRLVTLELPRRGNQIGQSCIPSGLYRVVWSLSPRLAKRTYAIEGVRGRTGIRIHSGNFAGDTQLGFQSHSLGCPLFGRRLGAIGGQLAVLASREAIGRFESEMNREPFDLEIVDA